MRRSVRGWRVVALTAVLVSGLITPAVAEPAVGHTRAIEQIAAPVADPLTLEAASVVAEGRSLRAGIEGVPAYVSAEAIMTDTSTLFYGPGFTEVADDSGTVVGDRLSWLAGTDPDDDNTVVVISERFDGSDRRSYTPANTVVALIPGGWLEARWIGDDVVLDVVQAADGRELTRTTTPTVFHLENGAGSRLSRYGWTITTEVTVFTIGTEDGELSIPVRYRFDDGSVRPLAPPISLADQPWTVAGVNEGAALLSRFTADGYDVRTVAPDDSTVDWAAVGYPHFLGRDPVWEAAGGFQRGNADGSVTELGPEPPFGYGGTLSVGDRLYATDSRDGLLRTDLQGDNRQVLSAGPASYPLTVGAVAVQGETVAWTDDRTLLADGTDERSRAWRTTLGPAGAGDRELVAADVLSGALAQQGGTTFVAGRNEVLAVAANGATSPVAPVAADPFYSSPREIAASDAEVLVRVNPGDGFLVDRTTGSVSPSTVLSVSDRWRVRVDVEPVEDGFHSLIVTSVETGIDRVITIVNETAFSTALVGDVLVWTEAPTYLNAPENKQTLHWVDLTDPDPVWDMVDISARAECCVSAAGDGWFLLTGSRGGIDSPSQALLYQVGVPTPRAVLAGAIGPAAADDDVVVWAQAGPDGDRVVAAPLPDPIEVPAVAGMYRSVDPQWVANVGVGGSGPPLGSGESTTIDLHRSWSALPPTGVRAVTVNVTVAEPTASGYLAVYPGGTEPTGVSQLNFTASRGASNLVTVPIGSDGTITVSNPSSGSVQLAVYLVGYYNAGVATDPGAYVPVTATRTVDSRIGLGVPRALAGTRSARVDVTGVAGIPDQGVSAVVGTLTATEPKSFGYLTAYPSGTEPPAVSNLNFEAGESVGDQVTVPVGADGTIVIANAGSGSTEVLFDVAGYYLGGTPTARGAFVPVGPQRVLDTRVGDDGPVPGGTVLLAPGFPPESDRIVATVTVTEPVGDGGVALGFDPWRAEFGEPPLTDDFAFRNLQTVAKQVVGPLEDDGSLPIWINRAGSAHTIVDLSGYFIR